jgi:O-antigen/teichoic acid export membrane protein
MTLSIISIAKNSLKFSAVSVISALLGLLVTLYIATVLAPEEYGIYGFLSLWLLYAGLIGPGILSAGYREMPVLLGKGQEGEALRIQNVSLSSQMLYLIIPFAVMLGASFFYLDTVMKIGLVIIAATYVMSQLASSWSVMNFVREKFNTIAGGNLIVAIIAPVVTLLSIHWLRVYALLIAPLVANIILWVYYLKWGSIGYRFKFDRGETLRLLKIGVILQALTLIYWAFRLADRTIIAATLPLEQLGLYTYAMAFLMYALTIPTNFGNVLQPILWRAAGKATSIYEGFKDTRRMAVYMALGVAILIPIAQLFYYSIINLIATKYAGSIPIFYVLSYNLYLVSLSIIPGLVLTASMVNRQNIGLALWAIGLALSIALDMLVISLGYGVVGVAWVTICAQALVTFILYRLIKRHIFEDRKGFLVFMIRIMIPFLATIPFYFLHNYLGLMASSMWTYVAISLAAQMIIWSLLIGVFYRDYLSIHEIKILVKEIKTVLKMDGV